MDNYLSILTQAVGEMLIRTALEKPKGTSFGAGRARDTITYTEDELLAYSENQEVLRREIRNVASKKSVYKRKIGDKFTEEFAATDPIWLELMKADEQLKNVRVAIPRAPLTTFREKISSIIGETNLETVKGAEAKRLLNEIAKSMGIVESDEEPTDEQQPE
jgi:hypothetical protein